MKWAQIYGSLNILWHCLSLALEWKLTFSSPCGQCRGFQICWYMECSILTASSFRILNNSPGIWSPPQKELFTHKWAAVGLWCSEQSERCLVPTPRVRAEGWGWRMGYWLFSVSLFKRWELKGEDYVTPNMPLWRHKVVLSCLFWETEDGLQLFVTPWTVQSIEFSRPEYWSGQLFPSPGDLPNSGIKPRSPALQADSLPAEPPWKPKEKLWKQNKGYPFRREIYIRKRAVARENFLLDRLPCMAGHLYLWNIDSSHLPLLKPWLHPLAQQGV